MRDRANEGAPSFPGAVYFRIRPGAHFRHGGVSRGDPSATWSRPMIPPPAPALPQWKQPPGRAFPIDLVQPQPARLIRRSIPPGQIVRLPAEPAAPALVAA